MFGTQQVMAVLLEAQELRLLHRNWPVKMRLAVCLMPSGECQLLLFREEETSHFPQRLRKHLGLRAEEIAIHPPVVGFPSRPMKYSDERSLESLLADTPEIVEDANDYSVNYAFAMEEGLNPSEFMGVELPESNRTEQVPPTMAPEEAVLQFASTRRAPKVSTDQPPVRQLNLGLAADPEPEAPKGFSSALAGLRAISEAVAAAEVEEQDKAPGSGFMSATQLREMEAPPGIYALGFDDGAAVIRRQSGDLVYIDDPAALYLRDDHRLLAVRLPGGTERLPGVIRIAKEAMPSAIRRVLALAAGEVNLSKEGDFAYIALNAPKVAETKPQQQKVASISKPAKRGLFSGIVRNRGVRLFGMTIATALTIYLVLGAQPDGLIDQNTNKKPIDWKQFRLSMQADTIGS